MMGTNVKIHLTMMIILKVGQQSDEDHEYDVYDTNNQERKWFEQFYQDPST